MTLKSCIECGTPCTGSRCPDHTLKRRQPSATARGYDYHYRQLRDDAIALQGFCTDCLTTDKLTLDHTVESWRKVQHGQRLTLKDVGDGLLVVRCIRCNIAAGHARGATITHD